MRTLLARLQARLEAFSEQRDDFTLVVRCDDPACAHVLKTLQAIDEGGSPDLYWSFAEPFTDPAGYADAVVNAFAERHAGVRERQAADGGTPWPVLPATLTDSRRPPAERLREAMIFSRRLLPSLDGHVGVWALFPVRIDDAGGYAALIRALAAHRHPAPWCHHLRLLVRDADAAPVLHRLSREAPGVQHYAPDLSPDAIEASFAEEAADEQVALPLRMQALLVLAGMDYAHRRYGDALEKYTLLNRYYRTIENDELTALTFNGMGEVYRQAGQDPEALQHFEWALPPALRAESPPVLLNVTLNLANLHLAHERWDEAATYYDGADKLATAQLNAPVKIRSLESRGYCEACLRQYDRAVQSWTEAADVARSVEEPELLRPVLERLHDLYRQGGLEQECRAIADELKELS